MKLFRDLFSPRTPWTTPLVVLSLILAGLMYMRTMSSRSGEEGFESGALLRQSNAGEKYAMKRGVAAFDDFYAEFYDQIYKTADRAEFEAELLVKNTQMDSTSNVLDIGCGTGCLVSKLAQRNIRAQGTDPSPSMIGKSPAGCRTTPFDERDSMAFERGELTHVLALDRTVYKVADKVAFFRKCHHWLVPGGYLAVHLVDPAKFDAIVPLAKSLSRLDGLPPARAGAKRITASVIDFADMKYKSAYEFDDAIGGVVVQKETFTDAATGQIRQNEHIFAMDSIDKVVETAQFCRFSLVGQYNYALDPNQFVYIFSKM